MATPATLAFAFAVGGLGLRIKPFTGGNPPLMAYWGSVGFPGITGGVAIDRVESLEWFDLIELK
jgi:hypothetical protein